MSHSPSVSCFTLVAEHADFWLIDKAPGVDCMSSDGEAGLFHQAGEVLGDCYPVHRLDKMTSGLLLLAKSSQAAAGLAELFKQHKIQKYYLAISADKPKKKQGWIKGGMARSRRGQWRLTREQDNFAKTQFISFAHPKGRLFVLKPFSGRTHQLRVALKSIASPILGDELYSGAKAQRGFLHAQALCFEWQGQQQRYISPTNYQQDFLPMDSDLLEAPWLGFDKKNG